MRYFEAIRSRPGRASRIEFSMSSTSRTRRIGVAVACVSVIPALMLTGCSSQKTLSKSEVESQAQSALTASVGQQAPAITCPGDLDAKVGATETCAITLDSKVYDVTVTVTSVDESTNNAKFDVQVAKTPRA